MDRYLKKSQKSDKNKENLDLISDVNDENQSPNGQKLLRKRKLRQNITHHVALKQVCKEISPEKSVMSPWVKNNASIFDMIGNQTSGRKINFDESSPNKSNGNPTTPKKKRIGADSDEKAVHIDVSFLDKQPAPIIPQQQK
jgi:hypothetical protein